MCCANGWQAMNYYVALDWVLVIYLVILLSKFYSLNNSNNTLSMVKIVSVNL